MSNRLPTPPTDECKPVLSSRRTTKSSKTSSRVTKRNNASLSHEPKEIVMGGRHKRVWKACARCRMKKIKCDGESPCKRCKGDGLVCVAGSMKTEFKQLPQGYAEVLENTQYALITTVQKLYSMLRNGESWDLGEPELNDRSLPVIHNIAEKLGCIRPSLDMPQSFPEDAEEFAELQRQLFAGKLDNSDGRTSEDSIPHPDRMERSSSTKSDHSVLSKDYTQTPWAQQQRQNKSLAQYQSSQKECPQFGVEPLFQNDYNKQEPGQGIRDISSNSPVYSNFQAQSQLQSPVFQTQSPFSPWSAGTEEYLEPSSILDVTVLYMQQQQKQQFKQFNTLRMQHPNTSGMVSPISPNMDSGHPNGFNLRASTFMASTDWMIQPNMMDCNLGLELADQIDNIMFGDHETMTMT